MGQDGRHGWASGFEPWAMGHGCDARVGGQWVNGRQWSIVPLGAIGRVDWPDGYKLRLPGFHFPRVRAAAPYLNAIRLWSCGYPLSRLLLLLGCWCCRSIEGLPLPLFFRSLPGFPLLPCIASASCSGSRPAGSILGNAPSPSCRPLKRDDGPIGHPIPSVPRIAPLATKTPPHPPRSQ
ncbi:hypothetical protein B0H67DRAFT_328297 [Lasiosphaeris hirsuta]|uniref:Uncharacterized protein n=1 Tax=Lasiosphaeris hirsuta TaxID=260670 RepID=A0AA40A2I2_9PEZI|nr:hypothetical protein B0H67DRAFT_328297 [Lasiosphaeris hirsuta]